MNRWRSHALTLAYVALFGIGVSGCDTALIGSSERQIAAALIGILGGDGGCTGNTASGCASGCGGCSSCGSSCGNCTDCGDCGCGTCTIQPIPGGFRNAHGSAPNKGVVPNAATVRLTSSGLAFVGSQLPKLVSGLVSVVPINQSGSGTGYSYSVSGRLFLELEGPNGAGSSPILSAVQNVTDEYTNTGAHDALRLQIGAHFKSCAACTNDEKYCAGTNGGPDYCMNTTGATCSRSNPANFRDLAVCNGTSTPSTLNVRYTIAGNTSNCTVTMDSRGGTYPNLPITANIGFINQSSGPDTGLSRVAILDTSTPEDGNGQALGLEGADFVSTCASNIANVQLILDGGLDSLGSLTANNPYDGVRDQLNAIIDAQVRQQVIPALCNPPKNPVNPMNAPTAGQNDCPTGTQFCAAGNDADGHARPAYCKLDAAAACNAVPMPACLAPKLGTEGRIDIGAAEAVVTPGITAIIDFFLNVGDQTVTSALGAAIDGGHTVAGPAGQAGLGYNLDLLFGLEALAHNPCVPVTTPPTNVIPDIAALRANRTPGTPAGVTPSVAPRDFHVGVGLTEAFANYAAWKLFDSGVMCLGVSSALAAQLDAGQLSFAVFADPGRWLFPLDITTASRTYLALSLRPQQAPTVAFSSDANPQPATYPTGTATNVTVTLSNLEIDFQYWVQERYMRVGTVKTDLVIELQLRMEAGTLVVDLKKVDFVGSQWVNSPLLSEAEFAPSGDHFLIEDKLDGIAGAAIAAIGGSLLPFKLPIQDQINGLLWGCGVAMPSTPPLDLKIRFQDDAIQGFDTNSQRGMGFFIDLADRDYTNPTTGADQCPLTGQTETSLEVTKVTIPSDHTALEPATMRQGGALPQVEIAMNASGPEGVQFEYSYRTELTGWSDWSSSPYAVIDHSSLAIQAEHTIFARSRVAGDPLTADLTPATATVKVDVTAPLMQVSQQADGSTRLEAVDGVDAADTMEYRVRAPGGSWSEWQSMGTNVVSLGALDPLSEVEVRDESGNVASNVAALRGRTSVATAGGCGSCAVGAEPTSESPLGVLAGLMVVGLAVARRRRRG